MAEAHPQSCSTLQTSWSAWDTAPGHSALSTLQVTCPMRHILEAVQRQLLYVIVQDVLDCLGV